MDELQKEERKGDSQPPITGNKSCCKVQNHEHEEIVFACYECSDTFCRLCIADHENHTVIFFKDTYLVSNYDEVTQIQPKEAYGLKDNLGAEVRDQEGC